MQQEKRSRNSPVKVFIIHADADADFAGDVRRLLANRVNARVFTTEKKSATKAWLSRLRNELASSDVVVALLTPSSPKSRWVLQEIGAAWVLRKQIISVVARRDLLSKIPVALDKASSIELSDVRTTKNADKFVDAFEESLAAGQIS